MTLVSLTSRLVQFLSFLYYDRLWATWELLALAAAALLLLVALRQRRKVRPVKIVARPAEAHSQIIGTRLSNRIEGYPHAEDNNGGRLAPAPTPKQTSKKNPGWREATKKYKSFRQLVEELQYEVVKYKRAEDCFKQQVVKLTDMNRQLEERLSERTGQNTELAGNVTASRLLR